MNRLFFLSALVLVSFSHSVAAERLNVVLILLKDSSTSLNRDSIV